MDQISTPQIPQMPAQPQGIPPIPNFPQPQQNMQNVQNMQNIQVVPQIPTVSNIPQIPMQNIQIQPQISQPIPQPVQPIPQMQPIPQVPQTPQISPLPQIPVQQIPQPQQPQPQIAQQSQPEVTVQQPISQPDPQTIPQSIPQESPQQDSQQMSLEDLEKQNEEPQLTEEQEIKKVNLAFFNEHHLKIIRRYKRFHHYIFKQGIYVLLTIATLRLGYHFLSTSQKSYIPIYETHQEETQTLQQTKTENFDYQDLEIINKIGTLSINKVNDNTLLKSSRNLIKYQGIILGNNTVINLDQELFDQEKFDNDEYTQEDIQKLFFKLMQEGEEEEVEKKQFRIKESVLDDFNLQCIKNYSFYPNICYKFFDNFVQYGHFYNLEEYLPDLNQIYLGIKGNQQKKSDFCSLLLNYALYQENTADNLDTLLSQCSMEEYNQYINNKYLITVNQEISQKIIKSKVFNSKEINAYKSISLMAMLYKNFENGVYNTTLINNYLEFIKELVNKDDSHNTYLDPIYKNIIYFFNNNILQSKLENNAKNNLTKAEINTFVNKITEINKGDKAFGTIGLEKQITIKDLINYKQLQSSATYEVDIETPLNSLLLLKNLRISKSTISEDRKQVEIQTQILFEQHSDAVMRARIWLYLEDNVLYLKNIRIIDNDEFTALLMDYNNIERHTLPQMLNIMNENVDNYLYKETQKINYCTYFTSDEYKTECENDMMTIVKNKIHYQFIFKDNALVTFHITDQEKEKKIRMQLEKVIFNEANTLQIIEEILKDETEDEIIIEEDAENTSNLFIIKEKIKDYLRTNPIIEKTENPTIYKVTFTINDITLTANYDLPTHTLTQVSYVINENETLLIRKLEIELAEINRDTLSYMANNPRTYLRLFNTAAYDKYERLQKGITFENTLLGGH